MQLNTLFRILKNQRIHMAIVQDQKGETLGIVTMYDLLEELFEDIDES